MHWFHYYKGMSRQFPGITMALLLFCSNQSFAEQQKRDIDGITLGQSREEVLEMVETGKLRLCDEQNRAQGKNYLINFLHSPNVGYAGCQINQSSAISMRFTMNLSPKVVSWVSLQFCSAEPAPIVAQRVIETYGLRAKGWEQLGPQDATHPPLCEGQMGEHKHVLRLTNENMVVILERSEVLGSASGGCIAEQVDKYILDICDPGINLRDNEAGIAKNKKSAPTPDF